MTDDRAPFREARLAGKAIQQQQRLTEAHVYRSTACFHGVHGHCQSKANLEGQPKEPATCKWCTSKCVCDCHEETP